jgi:peroxiredoxin Q/BCP
MSIRGIAKLVFNSLLRKEFPMVGVGAEAPPFEIEDHRGRPVSLDAFRGRYVVLWFFPKADTPG